MQAQKERWRQLCEQVVLEQNPIRFQQLVDELNEVLEEKERRLVLSDTDRTTEQSFQPLNITASDQGD
jgi:hypothetical protein